MNLAGKRVLVVGLGRSGRAAASLARNQGARVTGVDTRIGLPPIDGVVLELGRHQRDRFLQAELIIVSPGVPPTQPDLAAARDAGVPILGELGFASLFVDVPTIAITGTNGKSTVTHFCGQILRHVGMRPFVGGNLGTPLSDFVLDAPKDGFGCAVVEVSSYQLEAAGSFCPDAGVILNLSPDHLQRHGDMEGYAKAKSRLFDHVVEELVVLCEDERIRRHVGSRGRMASMGTLPGWSRSGRRGQLQLPNGPIWDVNLDGVELIGEHNLDNALTAALLSLELGASLEGVLEAIGELTALEHRMQRVPGNDGRTYLNDSKATNIDAARVGISGLPSGSVVLLGGRGKDAPDGTLGFAALEELLRDKVVVTFGEAGDRIASELSGLPTVVQEGPFVDAMKRGQDLCSATGTLALCPGCSSFDEFDDFEQRGRVFAAFAAGEPDERTP